MTLGQATTVVIAVVLFGAREARARDRLETDASLGFAIPAGSLERASMLGDTTFGAASIQLDGAWFLARNVAVHAAISYAAGVPKLCASAGDCEASLGRDVAVDVGARIALFDVGRFAPRLDLGVGWEWYATSLSDNGVSSTRAYSGPTFGALDLAMPFRVSSRFAIGPALGARVGVFTSVTRTTPTWSDSSLDGEMVHAWVRFALDARLTF